jgi:hypothetical protein
MFFPTRKTKNKKLPSSSKGYREITQMSSMASYVSPDNENRRLEVDRRQFSYAFHIPERRSGKDRRCGLERKQEKTNE